MDQLVLQNNRDLVTLDKILTLPRHNLTAQLGTVPKKKHTSTKIIKKVKKKNVTTTALQRAPSHTADVQKVPPANTDIQRLKPKLSEVQRSPQKLTDVQRLPGKYVDGRRSIQNRKSAVILVNNSTDTKFRKKRSYDYR